MTDNLYNHIYISESKLDLLIIVELFKLMYPVKIIGRYKICKEF